MQGIIYEDDDWKGLTIVRAYDGFVPVGKRNNLRQVSLYRDSKHVYIDGVMFEIEALRRGEKQQLPKPNIRISSRDYVTELEGVLQSLQVQNDMLQGHLLVMGDFEQWVQDELNNVVRRITSLKLETERL